MVKMKMNLDWLIMEGLELDPNGSRHCYSEWHSFQS